MIPAVQFPPQTPLRVDVQSTVFVLLVLVVMPIGAVRSKSIVAGRRGRPAPRKSDILARALLVQMLLFAFAFFVARTEGMAIWSWTGLNPGTIAVAAAALAILLFVGALSWQLRTPDERRTLWMRHLLPRTSAQWALWLVVSLAAGIAEETAYRGVLVVLLASVTASFVVAAILSAAAFAIGLVMQAVVSATGTLYVAMGVHAVYDVTAAIRAAGQINDDAGEGSEERI